LPQPQIWQKRQEILSQWVTTESAPMKGGERMNVVVVRGQGHVINLEPWGWSKERTLYRVYIRELNRELCTRLSTLYTNT